MPETNKIREIMMKWFMLVNGGLDAYDIIEEVYKPYSYDVIADLIDDSEDEELNFDNLPCDYTTDEDDEEEDANVEYIYRIIERTRIANEGLRWDNQDPGEVLEE